MPEQVQWWWERRQRSKGAATPYEVGRFRADWERYPVLVRQYHPDLNHGLALTQVPPAADVWLLWQCDVGHTFVATPWEQRQRPGRSRRRSTWCPECTVDATGLPPRKEKPRARPLCSSSIATRFAVGEAFASECAPRRASAVEGDLHQRLADRLEFTPGVNAVRVGQPFFEHLEVWPDIVIPELKVAIEYDSTGRDGLEHVGRREAVDLRKDRALRGAGWEVVRIRTGKLPTLGPRDVSASGISNRVIDRLLDQLRDARGDLIVDCYLR
ncbi:zinc-ribbon domain-containing protein [Schumannella luteola]